MIANMDELLAGLRRQSAVAFAELVAEQNKREPELQRMLSEMARDCQRAFEQLKRERGQDGSSSAAGFQ